MPVSERLDHLLHGYFRIKCKKEFQDIANDIVSICIRYTGITKQNDYNLILSKTELKRNKLKRDAARKYKESHKYGRNEIKVGVFGDGAVGKSSLIIRFVENRFIEEYDPTIEDCQRCIHDIDGNLFLYDILDHAGQDEYAALSDQWMRECDVFMFVYSINSSESFESIASWIARAKRCRVTDEEVYGVIVGNKCDLENERRISMDEANEFIKDMGFDENFVLFETSAKKDINVKDIFYECARMEMYNYDKNNSNGDESDESCNCIVL